jgi:poly-gamma-glutamate synthesis protein (capsule biosynthesis protein)
MQPWELVSVDGRDCLFMYSMGNFISGQRWRPDFANPGADREYTGDAVLLQLRTQSGGEPGTLYAPEIVPVPVTNFLDPDHGMVVRRFSSSFIGSLPERLAAYYRNRYELMRGYLPVLPTMPQASILE